MFEVEEFVGEPERLPSLQAAKTGPLIYTTFGPNAPRRATMLSTSDFIETVCRPGPWPRLQGFHISCINFNSLHIVDSAIVPECSASVSCPRMVKIVGQLGL